MSIEIWAHCPTCEYDVLPDDDTHAVDVVWSQGQPFATVTECFGYPPVPAEIPIPLNRPASQVVNSLGWRQDNLGLRGAKRVTFTMLRSEYDAAPLHTKPPARVGWVPTFVGKHTDVVRWTYKPVPVVGDLSVMDEKALVLS